MNGRRCRVGRGTRSGTATATTGRVFECEGEGFGAETRCRGISFGWGMSANEIAVRSSILLGELFINTHLCIRWPDKGHIGGLKLMSLLLSRRTGFPEARDLDCSTGRQASSEAIVLGQIQDECCGFKWNRNVLGCMGCF